MNLYAYLAIATAPFQAKVLFPAPEGATFADVWREGVGFNHANAVSVKLSLADGSVEGIDAIQTPDDGEALANWLAVASVGDEFVWGRKADPSAE